MRISKYNAEGYFDPTAYEALMRIANEGRPEPPPYRPLVYISIPFTADVSGNTKRALRYCKFAVEQGAIPIAPHLFYPRFMDIRDKEQRSLALLFSLVLLRKCDALWWFGDQVTEGMAREFRAALRRDMRIKHFNDNLEEVHL